MAGIPDDPVIPQTKWLNNLLDSEVFTEYPIVLCTGRSEDEREMTEAWLKKHEIYYTRMFMRKAGDYRADYVIKRELLQEIRDMGLEPFVIVDDRQCVVDMWRKEGLFVLQCDPKPSRTEHHDYKFHDSIKYPLQIMVGPSGAGKSTQIAVCVKEGLISPGSVISSDSIRHELCGDFRDQSKNLKVFEAMHEIAEVRLRKGLPVILDATHLRNADRIKAAKLVPDTIPVRYVVIDRPLADKRASAGWRAGVSVKGKPLIEHHDQVFKSNIKAILAGDDLPNVTVEDLRK
jgi:predicted kinase